MNKEKYIREVLKNINCSKNEKVKMKNDLETDIQISLDNGETWEAIMSRLGSPIDYAKELNEGFGYLSKNKSKKNLIIGILIGIVSIVGVVFIAFQYFVPKTYPISDSHIFKEDMLKNQVVQVIGYLNDNDFDSMREISNEEMKPYVNKSEIGKAKDTLGELGIYKEITSQKYYEMSAKGETMALCEVVALYENRSVTYTISFDKDMKLAGFYMK